MSAASAAEIRANLGHPVVDDDGHCIEFFPALADYLRDEGVDPTGLSMKRLLPGAFGPFADWYALSPEERARSRVARRLLANQAALRSPVEDTLFPGV